MKSNLVDIPFSSIPLQFYDCKVAVCVEASGDDDPHVPDVDVHLLVLDGRRNLKHYARLRRGVKQPRNELIWKTEKNRVVAFGRSGRGTGEAIGVAETRQNYKLVREVQGGEYDAVVRQFFSNNEVNMVLVSIRTHNCTRMWDRAAFDSTSCERKQSRKFTIFAK